MRTSETPIVESDPPMQTATAATPPADPEVATWNEFQQNALEIARVERELREAQASATASAAQPLDGDDLELIVEREVALRTHSTRLEIRLGVLRRRRERLGDQLHVLIVRGRIQEQAKRRTAIAVLEQERAAIAEKERELHKALAALALKAQHVGARIAPLERQILELEIVTNRRVGIDLVAASPHDAPPDALLKPSAWRAFVESEPFAVARQALIMARAQGHAAEASRSHWIVVDETQGAIVQSSLD